MLFRSPGLDPNNSQTIYRVNKGKSNVRKIFVWYDMTKKWLTWMWRVWWTRETHQDQSSVAFIHLITVKHVFAIVLWVGCSSFARSKDRNKKFTIKVAWWEITILWKFFHPTNSFVSLDFIFMTTNFFFSLFASWTLSDMRWQMNKMFRVVWWAPLARFHL